MAWALGSGSIALSGGPGMISSAKCVRALLFLLGDGVLLGRAQRRQGPGDVGSARLLQGSRRDSHCCFLRHAGQ